MVSKYDIPTNEKLLAKEFEKLGRQFFGKVDAKNFPHAYELLDQLLDTVPQHSQKTKVYNKNRKII
ncbi:hypothetical protein [Enterococcus sp. AZ007]|uniref:hypothetical protein n=1 Tax=Enterococcus sp. AZ007 TaxID=2774839 RepID=UPI003F1FDF22